MNNRGRFLFKKMQPETIHGMFLHWLNWLLKDSGWRAYIRTKLKENELPVIDVSEGKQRRVAE
jgi:hypothetical protein